MIVLDTNVLCHTAIAVARGASLATRNRRHFADLDLPLLDPWND